MSNKNGEECWYALKVFYNRVFELEKQLSQEGVRSYIPLLHEDTVAGDKKIRKRKPAVSSLMFIRQSEHYLLELQDRMKATPKIFGRFYRAESVQQADGVGIGLYLTREILKRQNGYIKVKSAPGKGSEFILYIRRGRL